MKLKFIILFFLLFASFFIASCNVEEEKKQECFAVCLSDATHREGWYENCTGKRLIWDSCIVKDKKIFRTPSNCPSGIIGYNKCEYGWAEIQKEGGCKRIFCADDLTLGPRDILVRAGPPLNNTKK
ncbi:MAG: hypothetical protein WC755_00530 [Candidatus Woesearchaeota archaeon]|jgi:hypothetical protein